MSLLTGALAVAVAYSFASLKVLRQYERGVSFFLGRFWGTKGPGLAFVPLGFATMKRVSLRTVAMDIPPQDVITRDNVSVKVNAVLYLRVGDPSRAIIEIEDYLYATSQLAQTTLRSVLGEVELDELLADREKINAKLEKIIDLRTDPWGIDVSVVCPAFFRTNLHESFSGKDVAMQEAGMRLITQAKVDAAHIAAIVVKGIEARRHIILTERLGYQAYLSKRLARPLYNRMLGAQAKRLARRAGADPEEFLP